MASKLQGHPTYRGIYAYDAANEPANPPKQSPKYRGIYCYVAANKPAADPE
jgi:hypothetical protein